MKSTCWSVALALTAAMSAVADIHNWKSQPENNWDWTNPNNFEEGTAPSAGDMINIRNGLNVHVKADDAASWAIATDARTVLHPSKVGSYVIYDVGEGLDVTNFSSVATDWGEKYETYMDFSGLRKCGGGKLTLAGNGKKDTYQYYANMSVAEGELVLDTGVGGTTFGLLSMAKGSTLTLVGPNQTMTGLEGEGAFVRGPGNNAQDYLAGLRGPYEFSGTLSDNCYFWVGSRQHFLCTNLTMTAQLYAYDNSGKMTAGPYAGLLKFGNAGEPSSAGTHGTLQCHTRGGGFRYLGTGERSNKNFWLYQTPSGPSFVDGGEHGGLELSGDIQLCSWGEGYSTFQRFAFIGENTNACVFSGHAPNAGKYSVYLIKDGPGTWKFTGNRNSTSGIAVKDGVLQFDSIAEKGTDCALGTAARTLDEFSGASADGHDVDYAYVLGGTNETALLEYVGTTAAKVTTRPAVLNGRGGFKSSFAPFDFTGVTSKGTDPTTLLLDGDGTVVNTIRDVTDGAGKIGIEKNGSGTWVLKGTNTFTGSVAVNAGTLRLSARTPYRWYRFNVKGMGGSEAKGSSSDTVLGYYFALFDKDGNPLTDNFSKCASASAIQGGQVGYWGPNNDFQQGNGTSGKDVDTMFVPNYTSVWGGYFLKTRTPWKARTFDVDDEDTWARVLIRLPDAAAQATSYDFVRDGGLESRSAYGIRIWSLDGSTDGEHWTELWETTTKDPVQAWGRYWASDNASAPTTLPTPLVRATGMQIASESVDGQLPTAVESWSVAEDATLVNEDDESLTVSKLTVDATKGVGKFSNFAFAETGTVDVRNVNFEKGVYQMSFTGDFSESEGFSNVANWTFLVDGKVSKKYTVSVSGSTITVTKNVGTIITLR